jgi:hypothetical protein
LTYGVARRRRIAEVKIKGRENNMAKSKPRSLPSFRSLDELVEFFDTHDLGEYWDKMPEACFEVDLKRRAHLIAIDVELAQKLDRIAQSRRTSSQALINSWLREKIIENEGKSL